MEIKEIKEEEPEEIEEDNIDEETEEIIEEPHRLKDVVVDEREKESPKRFIREPVKLPRWVACFITGCICMVFGIISTILYDYFRYGLFVK